MSDADIVREALAYAQDFFNEEGMQVRSSDAHIAIAALDRLVAERDAFKRARLDDVKLLEQRIEALKRAKAAEARERTLKEALAEVAVHITVSRGVRHQLPTGDGCAYCKLDQEMLDTIGEALSASERAQT